MPTQNRAIPATRESLESANLSYAALIFGPGELYVSSGTPSAPAWDHPLPLYGDHHIGGWEDPGDGFDFAAVTPVPHRRPLLTLSICTPGVGEAWGETDRESNHLYWSGQNPNSKPPAALLLRGWSPDHSGIAVQMLVHGLIYHGDAAGEYDDADGHHYVVSFFVDAAETETISGPSRVEHPTKSAYDASGEYALRRARRLLDEVTEMGERTDWEAQIWLSRASWFAHKAAQAFDHRD